MKTIPVIIAIAAATFTLASDSSTGQNSPPLPTGNVIGRFQLVAATVDDSMGTGSHKYLFRIDTATGRVWSYQHMPLTIDVRGHPELKETDVEGWVETEEDFNQSIKRAQSLGKTKANSN